MKHTLKPFYRTPMFTDFIFI